MRTHTQTHAHTHTNTHTHTDTPPHTTTDNTHTHTHTQTHTRARTHTHQSSESVWKKPPWPYSHGEVCSLPSQEPLGLLEPMLAFCVCLEFLSEISEM